MAIFEHSQNTISSSMFKNSHCSACLSPRPVWENHGPQPPYGLLGPNSATDGLFTPFWDKFYFLIINHQFHVDLEDSTCSHLKGMAFLPLMSSQVLQVWPSARGGSSQPLEMLKMRRGISNCHNDSGVLSKPEVMMLNILQCTRVPTAKNCLTPRAK